MKYLATIVILAGGILRGGMLSPQLDKKLSEVKDNAVFKVFIFPAEQPEYQELKQMFPTKKMRVDYLKDFASRTQASILAYLQSQSEDDVLEFQSFWVANVIRAELTKRAILSLINRPDVGYIEEVPVVKLLDVGSGSGGATPKDPTPEWNIQKINADDVWDLGYTGEGVIIGQLDTGVQASHPAFHNRFAGYWFDACNGTTVPYDDNSHGTHTMGTATGGDGPGPDVNDIGVAPGAHFTAAKVFDAGGNACNIMAAFQWYATLVGDSGVPVRVINNSWGSSSSTSLAFWSAVLTWRSLDIIPVFAIGNDGPSPYSTNTPGNYPTVIGVGATTQSDNVASFSSRGPAPNQSPWNDTQYWPRPDWNLTKPDVSAPGQNVRSSVPGGGYQGGYMWSGTSMATPHVTGAVAVMLQKNPFLDFETVYNILTESAYHPPQGGTFPNNNYGWGRIDLLAAINMVPAPSLPHIILVSYGISSGGDQNLDPGETGEITVYLTNLSDSTAHNASAVLRTDSPYITITDSSYSFGEIAHGDTVDNSSSPFVVEVDANTPSGTQVEFTVHFQSNNGDYQVDLPFSTFVGLPRYDFLDIHAGNATLTVTDKGAIGFTGSDQMNGSGFIYPGNGQNTLFYGSFALGNSSSYVADAWYESNGQDDNDFVTTQNPNGQLYYFDPPWGSGEAAWGMFSDQGHPDPHNIVVEQEAYGFNNPDWDDFVILRYFITANQDISNLYVGTFLDLDIGDYSQNTGGTDQNSRLAYLNYSGVYAGVSLLGPSNLANVSVIHNPDYVYPNQGMPDDTQWQFLNGTLSFDSANLPDDWSVMVSAGPFNMNAGDEIEVAFAVVGGTSQSDIIQNAENAIALYDTLITAVEEKNNPLPIPFVVYKIAPNPVTNNTNIRFGLPDTRNVELRIFDPSGREHAYYPLGTLKPGIHTFNLQLNTLPDGLYFVRIKAGNESIVRHIIKVK